MKQSYCFAASRRVFAAVVFFGFFHACTLNPHGEDPSGADENSVVGVPAGPQGDNAGLPDSLGSAPGSENGQMSAPESPPVVVAGEPASAPDPVLAEPDAGAPSRRRAEDAGAEVEVVEGGPNRSPVDDAATAEP